MADKPPQQGPGHALEVPRLVTCVHFPVFEHAKWLADAWQHGTPRHNLGSSGFVPGEPLTGLPRKLEPDDVAGLELHAATTYRNAVADHLGLPSDAVRPAAGTSGANLAAIAHLAGPGTHVVCERPYYAPMPHIAHGLGARVSFVDRGPDGRLDPHDVDAALDPETRLVMLTSPNNPTGHALDEDALRHLGESAAGVGAHVLVDQVFAELTDHARAAGLHPNLLSTAGFNKCWGAPGLRAGWIAGDPHVMESIEEVHRLLVQAPSATGTRLGIALLRERDLRRRLLEERLRANHTVLRNWCDRHGPVPHGDLVAFIPAAKDTWAHARRLLEQGILTVPGEMFGRAGSLRVGLGIPTDDLEAGLDALAAHM